MNTETEGSSEPDSRPIEPKRGAFPRLSLPKLIIFSILIVYVLISFYRVPILVRVGRYLVVDQALEKADVIVCLMGRPVERGLEAAKIYQSGFAPKIFVPREELPAAYSVLSKDGIHFPESRDLLLMVLQGSGVPKEDCTPGDEFVSSTLEEAQVVRELVLEEGYRSLILVTSPTHSRRAWLIFQKAFEKDDIRIIVKSSRYADFKPEDWWKKEKHLQEVVLEYQKLAYYRLKFL